MPHYDSSGWPDDEPVEDYERALSRDSLFAKRTDGWVTLLLLSVGAIFAVIGLASYLDIGLLPFVPILYFLAVGYTYAWIDNRNLRKELDSLTGKR